MAKCGASPSFLRRQTRFVHQINFATKVAARDNKNRKREEEEDALETASNKRLLRNQSRGMIFRVVKIFCMFYFSNDPAEHEN